MANVRKQELFSFCETDQIRFSLASPSQESVSSSQTDRLTQLSAVPVFRSLRAAGCDCTPQTQASLLSSGPRLVPVWIPPSGVSLVESPIPPTGPFLVFGSPPDFCPFLVPGPAFPIDSLPTTNSLVHGRPSPSSTPPSEIQRQYDASFPPIIQPTATRRITHSALMQSTSPVQTPRAKIKRALNDHWRHSFMFETKTPQPFSYFSTEEPWRAFIPQEIPRPSSSQESARAQLAPPEASPPPSIQGRVTPPSLHISRLMTDGGLRAFSLYREVVPPPPSREGAKPDPDKVELKA